MPHLKKILYADDDKFSVAKLLWLRMPPLVVGLILGIILSFLTSRFEQVLAKNIQVAFFIPFIVYMADAVGTQTQTIAVRDLSRRGSKFSNYLIKETFLGMILGGIFGVIAGGIVLFWFRDQPLAWSVGLSMMAAVGVAPLVALLVTEVLELERQDPAVGAGPIATVIQDTVSVVIYGLISSAIILS